MGILNIFAGIALTVFVTVACAGEPASKSELPETHPGLPRVFKLSERIHTGYEPKPNGGLESLKALGVKTIISVDGAKPDVEAAKKLGLRYVHIPIGYDSIPIQSQRAIFKVVKELEGPFYFHCHHGRHRGPASAAIALRADGTADAKAAEGVLVRCGTGKEYEGLWKSVAEYMPPPPGTKLPELHETTKLNDLSDAMAVIDRTFDHVELMRKAGWKTPPGHADLSLDHELLILGETMRTAARLNAKGYGEDMWLRMRESESITFNMRDDVKKGALESASMRFDELKQRCTSCHKMYRNAKK
jgi:protein tyrosine phosphatase (PTP) superfamily phosphohydrolase (DUF442 family)